METGLKNKVVLITGGSKGIGFACAEAFARVGARIAIASRSQDNLDNARQQLSEQGFDVMTHAADLKDAAQAAALVTVVENDLGPLDVLINSAGAAKRYPPATLTPQAWVDAMNAKYFTYINAMDTALKGMVERRRGAIVNIIGSGGKIPKPIHIPGGAANAALMLATTGLATAWASHGIRINGINPGSTSTGRVRGAAEAEAQMKGITADEVIEALQQRIPMGRLGTPEEVANVAVFLASDLASYVTGSLVAMDGSAHPTVLG